MFPLTDSTPRERFPFINYVIILINILVFFAQITAGSFEAFTLKHSFIPQEFSFINLNSYVPLFTSMFLHGGFFHILSNMWFLHIFGDNVEDRLGHFYYPLFYLGAGFASVVAQYFLDPASSVPMIGASGAISGTAGAYFVFYKRSTVKTVITLLFFWTIVELPATIVLGYWFISQLFAGIGSLASIDPNQGGVAFFAHIGGFLFGYIVAKLCGSSAGERT